MPEPVGVPDGGVAERRPRGPFDGGEACRLGCRLRVVGQTGRSASTRVQMEPCRRRGLDSERRFAVAAVPVATAVAVSAIQRTRASDSAWGPMTPPYISLCSQLSANDGGGSACLR